MALYDGARLLPAIQPESTARPQQNWLAVNIRIFKRPNPFKAPGTPDKPRQRQKIGRHSCVFRQRGAAIQTPNARLQLIPSPLSVFVSVRFAGVPHQETARSRSSQSLSCWARYNRILRR